MRMTLIDLLVSVFGLGLIATTCLSLVQPNSSYLLLPLVLVGTGAIYLAIASAIYKKKHWRPLILPRCPHCRRIHSLEILGAGELRELVRCTSCRGTFVADYGSRSVLPAELEKYFIQKLVWPQFIGRWKLHRKTTAEQTAAASPSMDP